MGMCKISLMHFIIDAFYHSTEISNYEYRTQVRLSKNIVKTKW